LNFEVFLVTLFCCGNLLFSSSGHQCDVNLQDFWNSIKSVLSPTSEMSPGFNTTESCSFHCLQVYFYISDAEVCGENAGKEMINSL